MQNLKENALGVILALNIVIKGFLRDIPYEKLMIKCSRVEKRLRDDAHSSKIQHTIQGTFSDDKIICCDGNICIHPNMPFFPTICRSQATPVDTQPFCEPLITGMYTNHYGNQEERILNGLPDLQTPFIYLRLYHRVQSFQNRDYSLLPVIGNDSSITVNDQESVNYLGDKLGESDKWFKGDDNSNGVWKRAFIDGGMEYDSNATFIQVKKSNGSLSYVLELLPFNRSYLLLPIAFYQHPKYRIPLRLYTPPEAPFTIIGAENINENPEAKVILTDKVATALDNVPSQKTVVAAVVGGDEAIPYTDIAPLVGRHVIWLILDPVNNQNDSKAKWRTAIKIAQLFHKHKIKLDFAEPVNFRWNYSLRALGEVYGTYDGITRVTRELLLKHAEKEGIFIPEELRTEKINNIEGDKLEKMKRLPLLIKHIIREAGCGVVFGATASQKSWLVTSVAIAVANGKSVFPDRWKVMAPNGVKCLTIAGEMDHGEYGERIARLHQVYTADQAHKKNFILNMPDDLDLASEKGFKQIHAIIDDAEKNCGQPGQPVKLLILDNLTTLSAEGENPSNFGRILYVLKSIKKRGIAVILVHHENQKGDIRGASKISDVMDMKFHVFKGENKDMLNIIVRNEKVRSEKEAEVATFKATLDVSTPGAGWVISDPAEKELIAMGESIESESSDEISRKVPKTKYKLTAWEWLNDDERVTSIITQVKEGLTNAQIAVNHNTSRTTICDFRKERNIRNCDLKKQMKALEVDE